ncbi:MAG: ribosomal protein S18-alanine N-acetyltransferase [Lachnospiraceae bacterium]|nr:ribosomal protein S18-alanine N-acetyltransferase [Lachnospiraceae bacterium]
MLQIENMQEKDIEQVSRIEEACFTLPWSAKSFEEVIGKPDALYLTALEGREVLGYCGAYVVLDEADINQVAVKESSRRQGIGKKLLEELLSRLKEQGITSVTLEVRKSNQAAIALYESLGFVLEGQRKNFYEKPMEDAWIMWKR